MRTLFAAVAASILLACGGSTSDASPSAKTEREREAALTMRTARATHGAVLLPDSRVLLIGGCVAESCDQGPDSATVDAFDPRTLSFVRVGSLAAARVSPAVASLPSGEILVAGGWSGSRVSDRVEAFDPATGRSRALAPLGLARSDIAVAQLADGRIVLAGGYDGRTATDVIEIFDPRSEQIRPAGSLRVARAGAGAALLPDGSVLLAGGGGEGMIPTETAERFDPASGKSTPTAPMAESRYKHAAVALADGRVAVIGGSDQRDRGGKRRSVEIFDPRTNRFGAGGTLLEARYKIGGAVQRLADGKLLIAGGATRAELYDPGTGRFAYVGPDLGKALNFATATLLPDGRVLVAGGYGEDGIRMNDKAWLIRPTP